MTIAPSISEKFSGYWSFQAQHSRPGSGYFHITSQGDYVWLLKVDPESPKQKGVPRGWFQQFYKILAVSDNTIELVLPGSDKGIVHEFYFSGNDLELRYAEDRDIYWSCRCIEKEEIPSDIIVFLNIK